MRRCLQTCCVATTACCAAVVQHKCCPSDEEAPEEEEVGPVSKVDTNPTPPPSYSSELVTPTAPPLPSQHGSSSNDEALRRWLEASPDPSIFSDTSSVAFQAVLNDVAEESEPEEAESEAAEPEAAVVPVAEQAARSAMFAVTVAGIYSAILNFFNSRVGSF